MDATAAQQAKFHYEKDPSTGDEFVVYPEVPIFDEHMGDDGVYYDKEILQSIVNNNNHRIEDTNDLCPVVAWHTQQEGDYDPKKDPPVIGWTEKFRLGKIGNKRPRWCIFAKFKIFKKFHDYFKSHPRRSVEIWPEEDPRQRYIDPIAVLGAVSPKRDLGYLYNKSATAEPKGAEGDLQLKDGARRGSSYSYSMAFPGGGNTYIPSGASDEKKKYELGSRADLDAKLGRELFGDDYGRQQPRGGGLDLGSLASGAIGSLGKEGGDSGAPKPPPATPQPPPPPMSTDDSQSNPPDEGGSQYAKDDGEETVSDLPGESLMALSDQEMGQIVEGVKPLILDMIQQELPGLVQKAVGEQVPEDELSEEEPEGEEPMAEGEGTVDAMVEGEGEEEMPELMSKSSGDPSDDAMYYAKAMFAKACEKYKLSSDSEADVEGAKQYMASLEDADRSSIQQYMESCSDCEKEKSMYSKLSADAVGAQVYSKARHEAAVQYQKKLEIEKDKYQKLQAKHRKSMDDLVELKSQLAESRRKERYSKINSRLVELEKDGYCFDRDKELGFCMSLSDEQVDEHITERIPSHYAKTPSGDLIPAIESERITAAPTKSEKYALAATDACSKLREQGVRKLEYKKVLNWMIANDTDKTPTPEDLGL